MFFFLLATDSIKLLIFCTNLIHNELKAVLFSRHIWKAQHLEIHRITWRPLMLTQQEKKCTVI